MNEALTSVGLTIREQELLLLMKWIDSKGGWSIRCGRLTLDFDQENKIGKMEIQTNYRPDGITTVQIVAR